MPGDKYIKIRIGDETVTYKSADEIPIGISFQLEDVEDFQKKTSSSALNIKHPASPDNDLQGNTFHNPSIEDLTEGEVFRSSQPAVIEANGTELLVGKSFLNNVSHTDKPEYYERSYFGNNADWMIDLKEATIYDYVNAISFPFETSIISDSWLFDGLDRNKPFVFAPVKYGKPIGGYQVVGSEFVPINDNMAPINMRPSISIYWIMFFAFKSLGYRMSSTFLNTYYFRRMVMPWVWGNFLNSEGTRLDIHKFLAKTDGPYNYIFVAGAPIQNIVSDPKVTNDNIAPAFDNNNEYSYNTGTNEMTWTYNPPNYGVLQAHFKCAIRIVADVINGGEQYYSIMWKKNGVLLDAQDGSFFDIHGNRIFELHSGLGTSETYDDIAEMTASITVAPGDVITVNLYLIAIPGGDGFTHFSGDVTFLLDYFTIGFGGTIDFGNYFGFKSHKFLDLLRGITDCFNLQWQTDPATKTVYVEPLHPYNLSGVRNGSKQTGYINGDFLDWSDKQDLSRESLIELYKDYEREVIMKFKNDNNDGIAKKLQDRHQVTISSSKYVFPERFKSGKREIENRFFAPVVHCELDEWKGISAYPGQMITLVPENISNTSASEAENTFTPRICYYKGLINGRGWKYNGATSIDFPFMFAVNYQDGGQNDPVLSYSDERLIQDGQFVIVHGLFKKFFWQRFAIMRNGQWYNTWFKLNNNDVANFMHREFKLFRGHRWELIAIQNYLPLMEETTRCLLRKWAAISRKDFDATFPSEASIAGDVIPGNAYDIKYQQAKCLSSDIPKI